MPEETRDPSSESASKEQVEDLAPEDQETVDVRGGGLTRARFEVPILKQTPHSGQGS